LQAKLAQAVRPFGLHALTDTAPLLEAQLAPRHSLGWRGKNNLVLQRKAGSMFFFVVLFIASAMPHSAPVTDHCGQCSACIDLCPTAAIVGPHQLDARRCISYLTIEHAGPIPIELRPLIGNRIYGCDECQLVCPWNKYAQRSSLPDFDARAGLVDASLATLLAWDEAEFLRRTEGSAIRRIGHARWLRNVALAAGNALAAQRLKQQTPTPLIAMTLSSAAEAQELKTLLQGLTQHADEVVREQASWSLAQVV
jgi:epoxyqueuosine reductase